MFYYLEAIGEDIKALKKEVIHKKLYFLAMSFFLKKKSSHFINILKILKINKICQMRKKYKKERNIGIKSTEHVQAFIGRTISFPIIK